MEAYIPNQPSEKKPNPSLIIIAALIAALLLQFIYFNHRLSTAEKSSKIHQKQGLAAGEASAPAFSQHSQSNSAAVRPRKQNFSNQALDDFFSEDPFTELEKIHNRIYHMMNTARTYAPFVMQQMNQDMSSDFIPAIDMEETDKSYVVRCDIPGLEKDKIDITTKNNLLIIQGVRESQSKQQDEKGGFYSVERSYGSFARSVPLPGPVDESGIKADYKNGVLTIEVPKVKAASPAVKRIPVQ